MFQKKLKQFQNVQFNLESKNEIHYIKFYKEIFEIINYITNLFPIDDYKFELKAIYPSYITYKRLQQLVSYEFNYNRINYNNQFNESPIQANEIIKLFRSFLLLILLRTFSFIKFTFSQILNNTWILGKQKK